MVFPERTNTEFIYLHEVEVDFELRVQLIRQARHSIDIISLSQALDPIGKVLLYSIREVQKAYGVKVRFIYDRLASFIDRDFNNNSGKMLADAALDYPGQIVGMRLADKRKVGLAWDDFFHEKALIIDAGTENECIFIGGRGYTLFSSIVSDSAYLIRPINYKLPYLGTDILENFNEIWNLAVRLSPPLKPKYKFADQKKISTNKSDFFVKSEQQRNKVEDILSTLKGSTSDALKDFQFRPKFAQLISNDLIQALLDKQPGKKEGNREALSCHNHERMIEDILHFNGIVEVSSYCIGFTDELMKALADFVHRGNTLNLYTNSQSSHRKFVPFGTPIYYTTEKLVRFISLTKNAKGNLNVYFLDAKKAGAKGEHEFLHRKLILFLSKEKSLVYTGTDNFTWSSAKKNDEWMIKIDDERMADHLQLLSHAELNWFTKVTQDEIFELDKKRTLLYSLTRGLIRNNY